MPCFAPETTFLATHFFCEKESPFDPRTRTDACDNGNEPVYRVAAAALLIAPTSDLTLKEKEPARGRSLGHSRPLVLLRFQEARLGETADDPPETRVGTVLEIPEEPAIHRMGQHDLPSESGRSFRSFFQRLPWHPTKRSGTLTSAPAARFQQAAGRTNLRKSVG